MDTLNSSYSYSQIFYILTNLSTDDSFVGERPFSPCDWSTLQSPFYPVCDKVPSTQYATKSQQLSLEPSIQQGHTSPCTYTPRSSWRETCYAPTPRSSWRETQGHEQIPFKVVLNPPLSEMMKVNLEGFHPFTFEVMRAQLPRKWKGPRLKKYNGTSDTEAHIKAYVTQANLF